MTRRICVVTGTRAEYGLLRLVIQGLHEAPDCDLQLIATGMHLSPEFGLTYREIEEDGFPIADRIEMLLSGDTPSAINKSIGLAMIGFGDSFARLRPDLVVLLGDRFEILAAATAALVQGIPIAHIHGGESTEGAIDEAIRHAVTKMAHLHFVAAEPYRHRVLQLGEAPDRVFPVGGLGIDAIRPLPLLSRSELEESLGFRFLERNLMVTFHPPTIEHGAAAGQMRELFSALDALGPEVGLLFTMPNADAGGRELARMIEGFVAERPNASAYSSLGQLRYLSCMKQMDGVVGNSSSGLLEAPSFGIGTVNIGERQAGRLRADSVIDCAPEREAIERALEQLFSAEFRERAAAAVNPYGGGGASEAIVATLRQHPLTGLLQKQFVDWLGTDTGSAAAERK